jgi:hypothetical protein
MIVVVPTVLLTFGIIAVLMGGMAVGVIFSNKPLRGSCGGVGGSCACEEAGTPGACMTPEDPAALAADVDLRFKPPGALVSLRRE